MKIFSALQKLYNVLYNIFKNMQNQETPIIPDQSVPPPAPPVSKIQIWAAAIKTQEGYNPTTRSYRNNNPGNLKYSAYTKTLGATGYDKDNFCVFPNYQTGFTALCRFLIDACSNKLPIYKNATILSFTRIYANPPNDNYAKNVASAIGVDVNTPIKQLL